MSSITHSSETKARALAALLMGERPAVISRNLGVPEGTVRSWKCRLKKQPDATLKKRGSIAFGELLMEHLETSLHSLIAQSKQMADPEWIHRQPAGELAVLFGILFDRTMRVFELAEVLLEDRGESDR